MSRIPLESLGIVVLTFLIGIAGLSCSPATISRIGLTRPPKPPGCPVEVLDPGVRPTRPVVDIGVVALQNCQEYNAGPCIKWLKEAVCELGGEVAYLPEPRPPKDEIDAVNYRVLVAIYAISSMGGDSETCAEPEADDTEPEQCVE